MKAVLNLAAANIVKPKEKTEANMNFVQQILCASGQRLKIVLVISMQHKELYTECNTVSDWLSGSVTLVALIVCPRLSLLGQPLTWFTPP